MRDHLSVVLLFFCFFFFSKFSHLACNYRHAPWACFIESCEVNKYVFRELKNCSVETPFIVMFEHSVLVVKALAVYEEREVCGHWARYRIDADDAVYSQLADYYYEERICILRCVLHLLTYFQDERHPYTVSTGTSSWL